MQQVDLVFTYPLPESVNWRTRCGIYIALSILACAVRMSKARLEHSLSCIVCPMESFVLY